MFNTELKTRLLYLGVLWNKALSCINILPALLNRSALCEECIGQQNNKMPERLHRVGGRKQAKYTLLVWK